MRRLWLTLGCDAGDLRRRDPRAGAELSEQDRPHRRALRAGRRRQHPRPAGRQQDAGADEAAGRDRQPARRRRQPRRRPGREIAARRLHAADALQRDGERVVALRQAAVRSGQGLRAGHDGDLDAIRDRRLAEKSGDESARSWSRSPRKSPAPTTTVRAAPARRCTCSPRCSAASPASSSCTSPIAATRR